MAGNQLCKQCLTLLEAVDNILESTGTEEEDIIILTPVHGDCFANDVDEFHRNDLHLNNVAGTLEVHKHNNDQCEAASDVTAF